MEVRDFLPTDTMHRRTPLPLCGCFIISDSAVVINTNSDAILQGVAASPSFMPITDTYYESDMGWEIVGSDGQAYPNWKCNVTLAGPSLYLSMGPEQWFAFDLETHEGAGFLSIYDSGPSRELNIQRYFQAIAYNLRDSTANRGGAGGL